MIVLHGQTPSHKNSKQIFRRGKRRVLVNNDRYLAWRDGAVVEAKSSRQPRYHRQAIKATFYCKDKRARDLDNMLASVLDVLVESMVIEDDNCFICPVIEAEFGGIDKDNPRAEVEVTELE